MQGSYIVTTQNSEDRAFVRMAATTGTAPIASVRQVRDPWQSRAALAMVCAVVAGCGTTGMADKLGMGGAAPVMKDGWTVLVDGATGMDNFNVVGAAIWSASDGALQAGAGGDKPSYLVSKASYGDFAIKVEFWASDDANSGVFLRCQDPTTITDENCYEANIFDQRPDPTYGTGAIVRVAKIGNPMPRAGGKWNTYEISAKGPKLIVVLNGKTTVDVEDSKLSKGPIALQWGKGTIRFRKVEVKAL